MQLNQASSLQIWDWRDSVQGALSLLAQKRQMASTYLNKHPPVTDDQLLRETIQLYNGGHYYKWNPSTKVWDAAPADGPHGYVSAVLNIISNKPWGSLLAGKKDSAERKPNRGATPRQRNVSARSR